MIRSRVSDEPNLMAPININTELITANIFEYKETATIDSIQINSNSFAQKCYKSNLQVYVTSSKDNKVSNDTNYCFPE